jgi:hypothetical protein
MGHLARVLRPSGPIHGSPPVPFLRVQEMWYPWHQILSVAAECLASELYPNVLDLPVLVKLSSATRLWLSTE